MNTGKTKEINKMETENKPSKAFTEFVSDKEAAEHIINKALQDLCDKYQMNHIRVEVYQALDVAKHIFVHTVIKVVL